MTILFKVLAFPVVAIVLSLLASAVLAIPYGVYKGVTGGSNKDTSINLIATLGILLGSLTAVYLLLVL